ncbi:protein-glucosylgalactosylhydroxylysine glucosidase-like [Lytechinus variegatus]|uniref:protein-glucosylgalactosylhydroxylysine glucosidase-like n=1 Tax=Lytechinus variegatus TaxID=7654 RepID=UPI001BB107CE|nr:protein-glucosylgalactosylhydroxylysine glucosidase-like [Lytechinus variegatus]
MALSPSSSGLPSYGSGCGKEGAEGAKNLWARTGSLKDVTICTYNVRSLLGEDRLYELEKELGNVIWDIVGLCEVRRRGEHLQQLKSGYLLYTRGKEESSIGGVGFLIHKTIASNVISYKSTSDRVSQIILKISKKQTMKIIQVYLPTSSHADEEVDMVYEEIAKLLDEDKANFTIVMGDFNAKVGKVHVDAPIIALDADEDITPVGVDEVAKALQEMKRGKAPGSDEVLVDVLKDGGDVILEQLAKLFTLCLGSCILGPRNLDVSTNADTYPELAQAMIKSRTMHLQAAKEYAVQTGEKGARFPWEMAYYRYNFFFHFAGFDVCPAPKPAEYEIHLNGDISFAVQQYLYATNDTNFLTNDKGYELVQELANYWAGRVTYDDYKEAYTILDVMPPDEDHAPVDNSVYTNAVAQIALRLPYYAASLLDQKLPDTWSKIADNMHIMYDQENDYHPEFEGYERGTIVKQADVILLGYPIMYEMDQSTRVNDLRYYETYTEHTGPAMTWGMFAVGWLELGDKQRAEDLFSESFLNIREPFKIWTETAQGTGAVNFITGMGGFLQAVLMGYGGLRLRQDGITMKITLPQDCLKLSFTGINYLGNSLDISGNSTAMIVELTERLEDAVDLDLKVSNYTFLRLSIGEPILVSGASIKIMPHRR